MDIKVLVADTQPLTREGIIALLADAKGINIAGVAANMAELKNLAKSLKPNVIILDHQYDDNFSVAADIKNIYRQFDFAGILILSNKQTRNEIMEVVNLGIINYISKESTQNEIIDAVYATAKREKFFCLRTREILSENQTKVNSDKDTAPLSTRETEIVQLIAEGMTNKEISEQLFLSIHTVKTHRKNIIKKLGFTFKNAADLMLYTSKRS